MEKFEQDIEQKLAGFNVEPSPQVWQGVEAALHQRRKKRFAFWLWLPIAFICMATTWLLLSNDKMYRITVVTATGTNAKTKTSYTTKTSEENGAATEANTLTNSNHTSTVTNTKSRQQINKGSMLLPTKNSKLQIAFTSPNTSTYQQNKITPKNVKEAGTSEILTRTNDTAKHKTAIATITGKTVDTLPIKDSSILTVQENKKNTPIKDSTITTTVTKKQIEKSRKHQWYIIGGSGISLVKNSTLFTGTTTSYTFNSSVSASPGVGSSSRNVLHVQQPNTGLSFMAGIHYETALNKHWGIVTGLRYRYIQNRQTVTDSANRFIKTETNHAHWLQLPLYMQYTFNAFTGTRLQLQAGPSIAWAFSENWLAVQSTGDYQYDKNLNNAAILGINAGVSILSNKGVKFGVLLEQGLTSIHKKGNDSHYLQQYSFQVGIPLGLLSKTKN